MTVYIFEDLASPPSQGYLSFLNEKSSVLNGKVWDDISYHNDLHWLKIWYSEDLTTAEEAELGSLVTQSQIQKKFAAQTGSEYFEMQSTNNGRWNRYRRRVRFSEKFSEPPQIWISDAVFDGVADIDVVNVTDSGFGFTITSNGSRRASSGITSAAFEWEAWVS